VTTLERTDVRRLDPAVIAPAPDLITVDVSFVSLTSILPSVAHLSAAAADWIVLVKPQFEAPRAVVDAGRGVVHDPDSRRDAVARVASALEAVGAAIMGAMVSPLRGASGNVEFLLHARVPAVASAPIDLDALVRVDGAD